MTTPHRPNFFIVGAPKCGTTAMYQYLSAHPEIYMPKTMKEPHYFAPEFQLPLATRYRSLDTYLSLFADVQAEKRIGEASVYYLYDQDAARRIHEFDSNARIIVMLRNPVDMIYSLFYQERLTGTETLKTFEEALAAERDRRRGIDVPQRVTPRKLYYREIGCYTEQVQRYFGYFGRENVHIIIFDDMQKDTAKIYRETLQFLDVDPDFQVAFIKHNTNQEPRIQYINQLIRQPPKWLESLHGSLRSVMPRAVRGFAWSTIKRLNARSRSRPAMNSETRRQLLAEFQTEIDGLSELLERDLSAWHQ